MVVQLAKELIELAEGVDAYAKGNEGFQKSKILNKL